MTTVERDFRLNRVFSTPLTRVFLKTKLTPNHVTLLSLLSGIAAGYLFSDGHYRTGVAAALFYQLACVLDNCDGEIARAKNMKSSLGAWLDIGADLVTDVVLFAGVAIGTSKLFPDAPVRPLLLLCLSGALMHFSLVVLEKQKGFGPASFEACNPDRKSRQHFLYKLFDCLREGEASWLVMLVALAGMSHVILWGGAVYMQVLWVTALVMNFRHLSAKR